MGRPGFLSTSLLLLSTFACEATAFTGTESIILNEITRASNQSLLWGPYRPNLYFGVKPRIPESFSSGLLWANVNEFEGVQKSQWERSLIGTLESCL